MDNLKETFTRKLGPLPVWAWAALALALILGWMYYKKIGIFGSAVDAGNAQQDTPTAAESTDTEAGGGGGGLGDLLGQTSTLSDPNRPGVTATGASSGYLTPSYGTQDLSSVVSLAAPAGSSTTPSPTYTPVYAQTHEGVVAAYSKPSYIPATTAFPALNRVLNYVKAATAPSSGTIHLQGRQGGNIAPG